ncbi:hypothetical protein MKX01_031336 [Papaver californicum]|nr:hypothetical protein MKX01_031336 [Papaver californicum]
MNLHAYSMLTYTYPISHFNTSTKTHYLNPYKSSFKTLLPVKSSVLPVSNVWIRKKKIETVNEEVKLRVEDEEKEGEKVKLKWIEIGTNISDEQKQAISKLPFKMTKRCKALMKQLICFGNNNQASDLNQLLTSWVRIMKPQRCDWLAVLKELTNLDHPLLFEVIELALLEESFEANVRDYTKIIDGYAKKGRILDAENVFHAMKTRGFVCDQVTLTTLINMYSKNGNLQRAEETFEDMKLLGLPLDKRAYGSMIMAYVRAGIAGHGENLLIEMESQEICAGSEVYKALLRAYSTVGDTKGAQRVFDSIQFAGIAPDERLCALLMNAYAVSGDCTGVRTVLENMRSAGLKPSDKCIALILSSYEKENKLNMALDLLIDLEKEGIMVGQEASDILAKWFRKLGVVGEVELVLRECTEQEDKAKMPAF